MQWPKPHLQMGHRRPRLDKYVVAGVQGMERSELDWPGFSQNIYLCTLSKKKEKKGQEGVGRRFPDAPGQCRGPLTDHLDDPSAVRDSESLFLITARPLPPPCGPPGWRQGPELPWQLGVPQWLAFHLCCPLKLSLSLGCGLSTGTASSH